MNSIFYMKLAFTNLKKNAKTYIPYLLSCIGTIAMFYMMNAIAASDSMSELEIGASLRSFLYMGVGIIGFFAVLFLFYTNSFLMKRRKKEFGLFNILGMEKRHIAKVLLFETLYTILLSLGLGIGIGIVMGKAMYLLLLRILHFDIQLGFSIPASSLKSTAILFLVIFVLSYLNTLRQIQLAKPIDFLKGGEKGEREPKAKWLITLIGLVTLLWGYKLALTVENPIEVMIDLFIAIILVIIGTHCLFMSGSIMVLKILRKNKKYYYKAKHFTTVSGMIYRMKQNAAGLANICILSTGVLLSVSTTVSMYVALEDLLVSRYQRELSVNSNYALPEEIAALEEAIAQTAEEENVEIQNKLSYRSVSMSLTEQDGTLQFTDMEDVSADSLAGVEVIPLDDYNQMTGEQETLDQGEVLFYTMKGTKFEDQIQVGEEQFKIKRVLDKLEIDSALSALMRKTYAIVVPDYETAIQIQKQYSGNEQESNGMKWYCGFDIGGDGQKQISFEKKLNENIGNLPAYVEGRESNQESFYALYGSLFFLGIFLGILFLMATVLIIYYKQISEGYEDRERFVIMQKVGMSHREVKRSIRSQILLVFFLPLVTAVIHITVAFPMLQKLLALMSLSNVSIFRNVLIITVLAFAVLYAWIYSLTARTYYKIVSQK